jgi:DNA polymerase-3 subunit gamma/tau
VEEFVVSARKYRPRTFGSVVGQEHVTNTLKNAIRMNQLAHAFLFSGPRGVGKTTCARILAKAINCTDLGEDGEPCNECASCASFNEGRSLNIHELDAASNNSVDDIRNIIDQVRYVPTSGKKSVFIIDEVHMLSSAAFNAFLKTLEEPPPHAVFILATTEKHKLLPTILSRVQKFDFRRIKVDSVAEHLVLICDQEKIKYEIDALQLIGLKADGALRDALSIFDQIVSFSNRNVTYDIVLENLNILDYDYFFQAVDKIMAKDHEGLLVMLNEIIDMGFEAKDFLTGLNEHFRNLLVARTPKTLNLLETSTKIKKRYQEQVTAVPANLLLNAFNLISNSESKMRGVSNPRLHVELALLKLAYLQNAIELAVEGEKKKLAQARNEKLAPPPSVSAEVPKKEKRKFNFNEKPKTVIRGSFALPKSMADLDKAVRKKQDESGEEEQEFVAYDPTVTVDEKKFEEALEALLKELSENSNLRIASILRRDGWRLDHNKWIQTVTSQIAHRQLKEERQLVTWMRERVGVPNLMLEIEIDEKSTTTNVEIPLTNQQKLELMMDKNPDLQDFMRRFDLFMNY